MEFTLDRIEDSIAVLIDGDGKIYECSSGLLPENAREGDVFTSDEYPFSKDFAPIPKPQKKAAEIRTY